MMKENIIYLFISGVILGSGPCLAICAPILISYTAAHRTTIKQSIISYFVFSISKLFSYVILGFLCALGVIILRSPIFLEYSTYIYTGLGCFIVLIGISTLIYRGHKITKACAWIHKGNIRNVGILGILVGFSPCLPLIGILNYIMLISDSSFQAMMFTFIFGIGTIVSPLLILVMLSAKIADKLSKSTRIKLIIRTICGLLFLFLGSQIILRTLLQ